MSSTPGAPPRSLLDFARAERGLLAGGALCAALAACAQVAFPQAIGRVVDQRALGAGLAALTVGLLAVEGLARAGERWFFAHASRRFVARLRRALFDHLLRQEMAFFEERRAGELASRVILDSAVLEPVLVEELGLFTRASVLAVGSTAVLLWMSPSLTALSLAVLAPLLALMHQVGRRRARFSAAYQDEAAALAGTAVEALGGIRTIRLFDQEAALSARFGAGTARVLEVGAREARVLALSAGIYAVGSELAAVLVLLMASLLAGGRLSAGTVAAFVLTGVFTLSALRNVGSSTAELRRVLGAVKTARELLQRAPETPSGWERPRRVEGRLSFRAVRFRYPSRPEREVLRGVDLEIEPGEVVALAGPSGAGKSTLAALLLRLHEPEAGTILLDGRDIRTLDPRWLRAQLAVVPQDPVLFSGTIAENIAFGRAEASPEELRAAAQAANAWEFVRTLPGGLEARVGERGVQLSGGQRQRIAIARAVLRDAPVLVLDEATSALDAESEHLVREALQRLMAGRTTLVIAHRLSTLRAARRVVVLEAGRVVESGTHADLRAAAGAYAQLVERQREAG